MKKTISFLLAAMLLLGLCACSGDNSKTPEATAAPTQQAAAPTAKPTAEPTASPEPTLSPSEEWAQLDQDFFKGYIASDCTTLHQLVTDPEAYGIDTSEIELSLGDYSKEKNSEWVSWCRDMNTRLRAINESELSDEQQLAYETVKRYLSEEIEGDLYYGCYEPLAAYVGIQSDLPLVFWFYTMETKADVEDYLTLLAGVPAFFDSLLSYEQARAERGIFMTESALTGVLDDLDTVINEKDSIFLIDTFNDAVDAIEELTAEERTAYKEKNLSLLTNEFNGAFVSLKEGLTALKSSCRTSEGMCYSADTSYAKYYAYQLGVSCGDDATPEEIADRLYNQMVSSYSEFYSAYSSLGSFPDTLNASVGTTEENIAYLKQVLDPLLPEIAEVNVTYENVPEALSEMLSPAAYLVASFDNWENNVVILNKPEEDDTILMTLAHEAYNGHLYQYVYHRSTEGLSLSQQLLEPTAYAEAWSQLSERLFVLNANRFNKAALLCHHAYYQFSTELSAYCSVLVNYYGYSSDDLFGYLSGNFGMARENSDSMFEMCVDMPFYYMPYAYSYARFQELYNNASEDLGKKFDAKTFYTQYLSYGPSYFDLIEDRLNSWVDAYFAS